MSAQSQNVIDVVDFDREVVARSATVPVLVDFWAPWCGPCRVLGPVLEGLAGELAGTFVLAKVNVDEQQAAAGRYGVSSIPDVKLFVDGQVKGGFVGALPASRVRAFLREHIPSEADRLVREGRERLAAGDAAAAASLFERALAADPAASAAHLELARVALGRRDIEALRRHAGSIAPAAPEREVVRYLEQAAELMREADALGDEAAVRARALAHPGDVEAHMALGAHRLAAGAYRDALESFLAAAETDRRWRDEAARRAMLTVFGLLGVRHPLADEFRRKLMVLY